MTVQKCRSGFDADHSNPCNWQSFQLSVKQTNFHRGHLGLIRARKGMVPWMLTINILLYPLLTYLATPSVQSHAHGQWVVICTLEGNKAVQIDFETASDRAPETCPALKLMHQLTGPDQVVPPGLPVLLLHALTGAPASQPYPYRPPHVRTYPPRAPPAV